MIEVRLSDQSLEATRKLEELSKEGELFDEKGVARSSAEVESATRRLADALAADLLRELGEESGGERSYRILNPQPSGGHRPGDHAGHLKVELGNGYCAYGHVEDSACFYDGIGRC